MDKKQKFYITTPIYYVNDVPHLGHLYTTLACDVIARFMRLDGADVIFLTGTDEHGQKVEKAAARSNKSPQVFVDEISENFRSLARQMNFTHDVFMRTTQPHHIKAAQALWTKLVDHDQIYPGEYSGWYAIRDEAYYQESELVNGKAPTGAEVEWVTEPSYFFRLSGWQDKLLNFYRNNPDFIAPVSRRNEVMRFVEGGLHDLSVSRTGFKWGVPVPGDSNHVMYVWLDALTNYLTALDYPDNFTESSQEFWANSMHVLGKDILRFHAVYWPAFLMAAGLNPPKRIFAHGWWTMNGEKMSKSVGNVVDPLALIKTYGRDAVRYFLMRETSFGNDGDFSHAALVGRLNTDLANSYGNLVQRVLSFIAKTCKGQIPPFGEMTDADNALLGKARDVLNTIRSFIHEQAIHKMVDSISKLINDTNRYVDEQKPWSLKISDPARMETILYVLAEVIRQIGFVTQPLVPDASHKILDQLAVPLNERSFSYWHVPLKPGTALPTPEGIFPRFIDKSPDV
jgi:methionyl-tRNA synthetase